MKNEETKNNKIVTYVLKNNIIKDEYNIVFKRCNLGLVLYENENCDSINFIYKNILYEVHNVTSKQLSNGVCIKLPNKDIIYIGKYENIKENKKFLIGNILYLYFDFITENINKAAFFGNIPYAAGVLKQRRVQMYVDYYTAIAGKNTNKIKLLEDYEWKDLK